MTINTWMLLLTLLRAGVYKFTLFLFRSPPYISHTSWTYLSSLPLYKGPFSTKSVSQSSLFLQDLTLHFLGNNTLEKGWANHWGPRRNFLSKIHTAGYHSSPFHQSEIHTSLCQLLSDFLIEPCSTRHTNLKYLSASWKVSCSRGYRCHPSSCSVTPCRKWWATSQQSNWC